MLRDRPITELVIDCLFYKYSMQHIRAESREYCLPGYYKILKCREGDMEVNYIDLVPKIVREQVLAKSLSACLP